MQGCRCDSVSAKTGPRCLTFRGDRSCASIQRRTQSLKRRTSRNSGNRFSDKVSFPKIISGQVRHRTETIRTEFVGSVRSIIAQAGRPSGARGTTPLASQRDDQLPCHPAISVLTRSGARKLTTQPHVAIAMVTPFDVSTAEACHAKVTAEGSCVSLFASCEQPTAFESLPRQQAWPRTKSGTRLISAEARDAKLHQLCHRRTAIEASNGQAITSRRRYR